MAEANITTKEKPARQAMPTGRQVGGKTTAPKAKAANVMAAQATRARLSRLRISPRKVRLVVDTVRGLPVDKALDQLTFSAKAAALPIQKLIKSAVANAQHNQNLSADNLFIKTITVDDGPTLKRFKPRAMGRATPIRKRTSHIKLELSEINATKKVEPKKDKTDSVKDEVVKQDVAPKKVALDTGQATSITGVTKTETKKSDASRHQTTNK